MHSAIGWLEALFGGVPLKLLQVWGGFGYLVGLMLMACAYTGLTLRPDGRWGLGQTRQCWDGKAMLSSVLTFVAIFFTGYLGSFIVLVPGAQTFESLKDLSVFLCIVLFGYPALLIAPFAYGLSDLVEGVPPNFLLDWLFGYFVNPACFWIAHQLIGRQPDFRRRATWGWYALFVLLFMAIEPLLWGHLTSPQFTAAIAYRNLVPALFFTTSITWLLAPFAMLAALPLARRYGLFWAEIPCHVMERRLGQPEWRWHAARGNQLQHEPLAAPDAGTTRLPIRLVLAVPFIALLLVAVGTTAYVTLTSAEAAADKLAGRLHQEIAENINLQLDEHLESLQHAGAAVDLGAIGAMLRKLPMAQHGRAIVIDRAGRLIASSAQPDKAGHADPVQTEALAELRRRVHGFDALLMPQLLRFDIVTSRPLARETWLMQATPYQDRSGQTDWLLLTAMPESYYLEGVRAGSSQSAMIFALALMLTLIAALALSALVTAPVRRLALATRALARGELDRRVPGSRLEELGALSAAFNHMAERLRRQNDDLEQSVRERTAALSVALTRAEAANRAKSIFLSNMSHELRTPLTAVIGFSDLLTGASNIDAGQRANLELINRSGYHLLGMINDILELSKLETGHTALQAAPLELPLLLASVIRACAQGPANDGVALLLHSDGVPGVVLADGAKLRQVLCNLVSNALKVVRSGSVTLAVTAEPAAGAGMRGMADIADMPAASDMLTLTFSVSDTGPGIAPQDREAIFQPFVQAATPAVQDGAGLGLSISRAFVELMGGQLKLESEPGRGARFWFSLTLQALDDSTTMADVAKQLSSAPAPLPPPEPATHPAPLAPSDLAPLGLEAGAALQDAVASLNLARIEWLIDGFETTLPALAPRLRQMVASAQYRQLWQLLDQARQLPGSPAAHGSVGSVSSVGTMGT